MAGLALLQQLAQSLVRPLIKIGPDSASINQPPSRGWLRNRNTVSTRHRVLSSQRESTTQELTHNVHVLELLNFWSKVIYVGVHCTVHCTGWVREQTGLTQAKLFSEFFEYR